MPQNTVPGFLYDGYGRQAYWGGGGVLHQRTAEDDRLRPRPANHFADYIALLSPWRYRELVSECRSIASRGIVSAILEQKADYIAASHYCPRFLGTDSDYGAKALEALQSALQICNVRGNRFDWRTTWRLSVPTRATDGSFFVLLTEWGDSGWPALQVLEGHRIGQRDAMGGIVGADDALTMLVADDGSSQEVRGAYVGLRIHNGVIYNAAGTEVAYRVLGGSKDEDEDISARDMIHVARPRRFSEGRPAPEMATAILDFLAIDLAQTCQLDQQIQDSRLTLIETNATGKYDAGAAFSGPPRTGTPLGTPTTIEERAQTRFVKSGMTLTPHEATRPSDQWMNFDWRVLQRAAASIRWRAEMLDPSKLGGAANRSFQDQVNTCIHDEFAIDAPAATRAVRYFVAKLTALGVIPKHAEWQSWGIAPPPWFEVDRASARLDLEDVAAGRVPMSVLHGRDGHTTAEVYNQRANAYELALAVQKQHAKVPLEYILGDLGMTAQRTGQFDNGGNNDASTPPAKPATP